MAHFADYWQAGSSFTGVVAGTTYFVSRMKCTIVHSVHRKAARVCGRINGSMVEGSGPE